MDPRYEFEAPKFVDFTKLGSEEDDQGVDSFFDVDMETGQAISGQGKFLSVTKLFLKETLLSIIIMCRGPAIIKEGKLELFYADLYENY